MQMIAFGGHIPFVKIIKNPHVKTDRQTASFWSMVPNVNNTGIQISPGIMFGVVELSAFIKREGYTGPFLINTPPLNNY